MIKELLKSFILILLLGIFTGAVATQAKNIIIEGDYIGQGGQEEMYGAPTNKTRYERSLLPETDSTYYLGSTTKAWLQATSDSFCLTGDSCITSWTAGSMTALPQGNLYVGNSSNEASATSTIYLDSNGNLGISSTTPSERLSVDGNLFLTGNITNGTWQGDAIDSEYLSLAHGNIYVGNASNVATATSSLYVLASNGNVGIGSTTPNWKLSVQGSLFSTDYQGIMDDDVGLLYNVEGALYKTLEDWYNATQSGGWFDGFNLSDNGDGSFEVSPGSGIIKTTNSPVGINVIGSVLASTTLWAVEDETVYVYADYNGGDVIFATSSTNIANGHTLINLGKVFREGLELHFFRAGQVTSDIPKRVIQRFNADGEVQLTSGALVSESGDRGLAITEAVLWGGLERFVSSAIDTMAGDTFEYYMTDGVGGFKYASNTATYIFNDVYDNSGATTSLGVNKFRTDFAYLSNDGDLLVMLGTNNDATLVTAREVTPPISTPPHISDFSTVIAKIIVQQGQTNLTEIDNLAGTTVFDASGTVIHNETTNKQGGTTDEYYHLTSAQHTNLTGGSPSFTNLTVTGQTTLANASTTNLTVTTNSNLGIVQTGTWNGTAIDISSYTNLVAGTNITLSGDTLNVDDSFLLNTGDIGTGAFDFGGATLEIPNGASGFTNTTGQMFIDTTSGQLRYNNGTATSTIQPFVYFKGTLLASSTEGISGEPGASATSTFIIPTMEENITITYIYCRTPINSNATSAIEVNGEYLLCDSDGTEDDGTISSPAVTKTTDYTLDILFNQVGLPKQTAITIKGVYDAN